ncbi:hypothetical protein [Pedobacter frigidisoli]|uniref:hypothetical protein n=1 Tax=Pedobacter frigidisoli TaxID=2530455 RepID=UPI002931CCD7|nr:hypothetical protein [Pedobacter frigidisoli]
MKKGKALSEFTLDELKERKKTITGIVLGLGIVMLISSVTLIYLAVKTHNVSLTGIAVACPLTFLPTLISLTQINNEIKKRS